MKFTGGNPKDFLVHFSICSTKKTTANFRANPHDETINEELHPSERGLLSQ